MATKHIQEGYQPKPSTDDLSKGYQPTAPKPSAQSSQGTPPNAGSSVRPPAVPKKQ